jgi:cell division protein FtsA
MAKSEPYVVGLDIGSTKIACVVGEPKEGGSLDVVGVGEAPSRGLRKGVVVNLEATVEAVKSSVEQAELMAGVQVDSAAVGIAGAHIRSFNSRGVVAITGRERTISKEDLNRVLEAARAVSIPEDREIVHVLVQEFVVDDQGGITSPVGMTAQRLEANVHIVTASTASMQNLVSCVNRAGVEVRDTVLEQLALAEAVLSRDEKELGVALIDVGGGTTDLAIFERGSIWHTAVLPVGGEHFTNDLAVGLRAPIPDAERLKRRYGCALSALVGENEAVEVPSVGGRKPRLLSRQVMAEILQPRAEEIFTLVQEEIARAGFSGQLNAGIVLMGGGCLLPGVPEVAEQIFELPVRLGQPDGTGGLPAPVAGLQHATAIGLALHGSRNQGTRRQAAVQAGSGLFTRMGGRFRAWFSEMF